MHKLLLKVLSSLISNTHWYQIYISLHNYLVFAEVPTNKVLNASPIVIYHAQYGGKMVVASYTFQTIISRDILQNNVSFTIMNILYLKTRNPYSETVLKSSYLLKFDREKAPTKMSPVSQRWRLQCPYVNHMIP